MALSVALSIPLCTPLSAEALSTSLLFRNSEVGGTFHFHQGQWAMLQRTDLNTVWSVCSPKISLSDFVARGMRMVCLMTTILERGEERSGSLTVTFRSRRHNLLLPLPLFW